MDGFIFNLNQHIQPIHTRFTGSLNLILTIWTPVKLALSHYLGNIVREIPKIKMAQCLKRKYILRMMKAGVMLLTTMVGAMSSSRAQNINHPPDLWRLQRSQRKPNRRRRNQPHLGLHTLRIKSQQRAHLIDQQSCSRITKSVTRNFE